MAAVSRLHRMIDALAALGDVDALHTVDQVLRIVLRGTNAWQKLQRIQKTSDRAISSLLSGKASIKPKNGHKQ